MPSHLDNPIFHDEDAARAWFEARIGPMVRSARTVARLSALLACKARLIVQAYFSAIRAVNVHGHGEHGLRVLQDTAKQGVPCHLPNEFKQERHQRAAATKFLGS